MSGGVDSSVSAALLKEAGYEVIGVFIRVWEPREGEAGYHCTWRAERRDAMRVAAVLDIPLLTLDLREEYRREVVEYMLQEYAAGHTPNPDVMCNKYVKFGGFYDWAIDAGADFVATGHYAQIEAGELITATDNNKDQTYFLWSLKKEQLSKIIFPIGGYRKSEVRKLAEKFKLPVAEKKDSQGLCFIGKINLKEFLRERLQTEPGSVLDLDGRVIGTHDGASLYTIGERHGFSVSAHSRDEEPLYIVSKNTEENTLTVATSPRNQSGRLASDKRVVVQEVNWLKDDLLVGGSYLARIRYRGELQPCSLASSGSGSAEIEFERSAAPIAPGQSLVLYDKTGKICLGGGIIS